MFVGRESELQKLNKLYHDGKFQCIIMYGRRRVGKTFLINHWMTDKQGIYFAFENNSAQLLLQKFTDVILERLPSAYISKFDSFEVAFRYIIEKSHGEQFIIALDEFQYVAMQDAGFLSMLQNLIDQQMLNTKLKLVLCGSYMSFMENEILGYKSPLYGRRTAAFKLEQLSFFESLELLGMDNLQAFESWAILGGMPLYLKQFHADYTTEQNIIEKILEKGSLLNNEPIFALKQELKEPAIYFSIIEAISRGRSKFNEIATYVGVEVGYYLKHLIDLGIVAKLTPVGEKSTSRRSIYRLNDHYFTFWFRYVSRAYSLVEREQGTIIYNEIIAPDISSYYGYRFEDYCKEYLIKLNGTGKLPFDFTEVGSWWGSDTLTKQQEEIDIVAVNGEAAIIAECKWHSNLIGVGELENLHRKSQLLKYTHKHLYFFSKAGFTPQAIEYARLEKINLISYVDAGND